MNVRFILDSDTRLLLEESAKKWPHLPLKDESLELDRKWYKVIGRAFRQGSVAVHVTQVGP